MNAETMDLEQLARYLRRDVREVSKLANRGRLPGRKVAGQWRFSRTEITHWLETQLPDYSEEELENLEGQPHNEEPELLICGMMRKACTAVPLQASTKSSVLHELVATAERSWQVYKPETLLDALKLREESLSTALENGVAVPHPRRILPNAFGESLIAYGRTFSGIPFGAPHGQLTDIFFLLCCRDDQTHLRTLARLSRLLLRPDFIDDLRVAETTAETLAVIEAAERDVVGL